MLCACACCATARSSPSSPVRWVVSVTYMQTFCDELADYDMHTACISAAIAKWSPRRSKLCRRVRCDASELLAVNLLGRHGPSGRPGGRYLSHPGLLRVIKPHTYYIHTYLYSCGHASGTTFFSFSKTEQGGQGCRPRCRPLWMPL